MPPLSEPPPEISNFESLVFIVVIYLLILAISVLLSYPTILLSSIYLVLSFVFVYKVVISATFTAILSLFVFT